MIYCISECIIKRKINIEKCGVRPPNLFLYFFVSAGRWAQLKILALDALSPEKAS
jgi:hypothetical protein